MMCVNNGERIKVLKATANACLMMAKALPENCTASKASYLMQAKECIKMAQILVLEEQSDRTVEYKMVA